MAARILPFPQRADVPGDLPTRPFSGMLATATGHTARSNCAIGGVLPAMDTASKASAAGLGCVRGTTLALAVEAAAGAMVYAMWVAIHLAH